MNAIIKKSTMLMVVALLLFYSSTLALAYYAPGETMNPTCAPGSSGCDVDPAVIINLDGATLATTTSGLLINLTNANTWTGAQTFSAAITAATSTNTINGLIMNSGALSGVASIAGSGALVISAGGANQNISLTPSGTGYTILNGNVGIGTTTPNNVLAINGGITLASTTPDTTTYALYNNAGALYWNGLSLQNALSGTEGQTLVFNSVDNAVATSTLFVASTGNVGIGTTNPTHKLEIIGDVAMLGSNSDAEGLKFHTQYSNDNTSSRIVFSERQDNTYGFSWLYAGGDNPVLGDTGFVLSNNTMYLMRHDGTAAGEVAMSISRVSGNVGIGTISPARKLHVQTTADEAPVRFQDATGYCEINPTTTAWTCTSDASLKTNVMTLGETLEAMLNLRPVNFDWKKQALTTEGVRGERTGLIAQEVEEIFPMLVTTDSETGLKSVSYGGLTIPLLKAV